MTEKVVVATVGLEAEKTPKLVRALLTENERTGSGDVLEPALIWKLDDAELPTPRSPVALLIVKLDDACPTGLLVPILLSSSLKLFDWSVSA
jgi:hypothetical protein